MHLSPRPRIVLLCHADEPFDREGLSAWLAGIADLAGIVVIGGARQRRRRALLREWRRRGLWGLCDVLAFRAWHGFRHARGDGAWTRAAIARLRALGRDPAGVPTIATDDPNGADVCAFLDRLSPDLVMARCKQLLKPCVFERPRAGVIVIHPGICPEYRNAHGCFWALVNRDFERIGVSVLRIDKGVDTGPMYFQSTCQADERHETHIVLQLRVIMDNLSGIAETLYRIADGTAVPIPTAHRRSAMWGQPTLSALWQWQRAMRRERRAEARASAMS